MKKYALTLCSVLLFLGSTYANNDEKLAEFNNKLNANTISFQENKGQVYDQNYHSRPDVLFSGQNQGLVYHLKNNGISYQLSRIDSYKEVEDERTKEKRKEIDQSTIYRIDVNWLNANIAAPIIKGEALQGYNNYYLASCPDGALNVKSYQNITYQNIYDGIDLKWYSKAGELKYDYLVAPGADYTNIKLEIKGAERIFINKKGELEIRTPLGTLIEKAPYVEQEGRELHSAWKIQNGNTIGFEIENSNPKLPLLIDPVVRVWGTYYGGTGNDRGLSCAVDVSGKVYLAGYTESNNGTAIATTGSHQSTYGGGGARDGFLAQFNSSGVRLWGTYYGGTGNDYGQSCAVDASGKVYFTGFTYSTTAIATTGSYKDSLEGSTDAFLVQFNTAGVRQWGTYYGGSSGDNGLSCAVDASDKVYMAGVTASTNGIATVGSHQPTYGGFPDAFLVQFDSAGVRQWGTYYGGISDDYGESCAVDIYGRVYLAGWTSSSNGIASVGCHQPTLEGGLDAFLVQFNSAGIRQWGTYYGGTAEDNGWVCAVDASDKVYLVGTTNSSNGIATVGSHQPTFGGWGDAFLVQFDATGVRQWGTYYGGGTFTYYSDWWGCAVDASGKVYMAGTTNSSSGIATVGSHQPVFGGNSDAFLVQFESSGVRLWGSYYGGTGSDLGYSCAVDASGKVYMAGNGGAPGTIIATTGSHQPTSGGWGDAFLVQFFECQIGTSTDVQTSCNSITWIDGNTYTSSTNTPTYTIAGGAANGCDSVVTLNFSHNPVTGTDVQTSCNSITWLDGNTYTSSTNTPTYTIVGGAVSGCDSLVTLNLTINANSSTDVVAACDSITWLDGTTYAVSTNTPTYTLINEAGCDSVITLNLTIINNDTSITQNINTLSAGATGATYQWLDCNNGNAIILGETNQSYSPASSGNYAVVVSKNGCTDTSACINFIITGISDLEKSFVKISPNPTTAEFIIELASFSPKTQLKIVSVEGKTVYTNNTINANKIVINAADWSTGVYMVKITDEQSSQVVKLIKQ